MEKKSFGALESPIDSRTVTHESMSTMAVTPVLQGGYDYLPSQLDDQLKVGICTSEITQNAGFAFNKKYSADLQYLLQKKYVDGNWTEGSAILSALKVGTKYGFLPAELWTHTSEEDRNDYSLYVTKLQNISDTEIQRLLALCENKLVGYASVNIDPASISQAILHSKAGILCRYTAGDSWYTDAQGEITWDASLIDPIKKPVNDLSGHAITMAKFDFTGVPFTTQANSWGDLWDRQGLCTIMFNDYKPTEIWIPYFSLTPEQTQELQQQLQTAQIQEIGLLQKFITYLKGLLTARTV